MWAADAGEVRPGHPYYVCSPKKGYNPPGHPAISSFWIREEALLAGLSGFLAERVFGHYRRDLLGAQLNGLVAGRQRERDRRLGALRKALAETENKRKRLIRSLEVAEPPDPELIRDINERRAEPLAERGQLERRIAEVEEEVHQAPNPALLGQLPVSAVDLAELPDPLSRRLFEALCLEMHYNHETKIVTCRITLSGETIRAVADTSTEAVVLPLSDPQAVRHTEETKMKTYHDLPPATFCVVPPVGFEPTLSVV